MGSLRLYKDAPALVKLAGKPVETKFPVRDYVPGRKDESGNDAPCPIKDYVTAWLHPLSPDERNLVRNQAARTYRFWMANGGTKETAGDAVSSVQCRFNVFYALRRGPEQGAPRFFQSEMEISEYPFDQDFVDIFNEYANNFIPTTEEWGNSLRARNSGTSPDSPASTPEQIPGVKPSEN